MPDFTVILIHGAWHTSWCWHKVARQLSSASLSVLTPDLPGHGSLRTLSSHISLDTYTRYIIDLVNQQTLPVCLVGHSMGGMIISQVANEIPNQIAQLVYVAAYIPQDRQSLFSIADESISRNLSSHIIIDKAKNEIRLDGSEDIPNLFYHLCSTDDKRDAVARLQPQPLRPFMDCVRLSERFVQIPKVSIICQHDRTLLSCDQLRMSRQVTDNIVYLEADHSPFLSATDQLTAEMITILSK